MKKTVICLLLFSVLLSLTGSGELKAEGKKDLKELLIGTWLELWEHGEVNYTGPTGEKRTRVMFTPGFHAYQGDFQNETYIKFNANGTGIFFTRGLLKNERGTYDVVLSEYNENTKKIEYKITDQLSKRVDFKWKINGNKIHIDQKLIGCLKDDLREYEIEYHQSPTRPGLSEELKIFNLEDEIIIKNIGQFLRITNPDLITDYNNRYKL